MDNSTCMVMAINNTGSNRDRTPIFKRKNYQNYTSTGLFGDLLFIPFNYMNINKIMVKLWDYMWDYDNYIR